MPSHHTVDLDYLVQLYGLDGVVLFPECSGKSWPGSGWLASVGLPHDELFFSRTEAGESEPLLVRIGELYDSRGWECPTESRDWLLLGVMSTADFAVDPVSGKVYGFPEGEDGYALLHRDIPAFVRFLAAFRVLMNGYRSADGGPVDALVSSFRAEVAAIDSLPLSDEDSVWNLILDDVLVDNY